MNSNIFANHISGLLATIYMVGTTISMVNTTIHMVVETTDLVGANVTIYIVEEKMFFRVDLYVFNEFNTLHNINSHHMRCRDYA